LLLQLIEAGLVVPADEAPPEARHGATLVPSPLPPAQATRPRSWQDAASITIELTGRALDPGHLELVVPVYRVAHPVLDGEGRQVGEANVFPAPLRLDVATEWRVCQHAGSRFQDEQPMNVTALRSMVRHWKPAMALLSCLRAGFLERFALDGRHWTVGDLQRFTSLVLALPAWMTMKAGRAVGNGELDPVVSSLFRVTDGVRMVLHRMMFTADNEPSRAPTAAIDAVSLYAYAERNTAFLSDHGVCAGPKAMIEEFLHVLFDGTAAADSPAFSSQVAAALGAVDEVFDYGLLGLQAYAITFSLWPRMARAYEALAALPGGRPLQPAVDYLRSATRLRDEERRRVLEAAYADMYAQCARGLGEAWSDDVLLHLLAATVDPAPDCRWAPPAWREPLAAWLADEQRVVRAAEAVQWRINRLLGRAAPARLLEARDLALHYRLVAFHYRAGELQDTGGRLPYLDDDLEDAFGISLRVDAEAVRTGERR